MKTLLLSLLVSLTIVGSAEAKALGAVIVEGGKAQMIATDEPCKLKDKVANLDYRMTWVEKGKEIEGCYGVNPMGIVTIYFADKTVVAVPLQVFRPVSEI